MQDADYVGLDAVDLAAAVRAGALAPDEPFQAAARRLERVNPWLGAVCLRTDLIAREALRTLDRAAPLAGVPFLMKDLGAPLQGVPTAAGCRYLSTHATPAPCDGDLTARFKRAGLVVLGKTTVPEFGLSLGTEPAIGPICRNPWDPARIAGGSSGGAAAAVAAGIVPIAHATDAGGSIRVPAACCGVFGLKPSRGLAPQGPDFGNTLMGLTAEHVVSRSVRDSAAVLDATSGGGFLKALETPPRRLRVGLVGEGPGGLVQDPAWARAVQRTGALLESLGHVVSPIEVGRLTPAIERSAEVFLDVVAANLAYEVGRMEPAPRDDAFEPLTWAVVRRGRAMDAARLVAAERALLGVGSAVGALFEEIDVLATSALAGPPPPLGAFPTDHEDVEAHFARLGAFAPFAVVFNVGGQPAAAVPRGLDERGLPVAVQLAGPIGADGLLLGLSAQVEAADPWPGPAPEAMSTVAR